jgi:transposase
MKERYGVLIHGSPKSLLWYPNLNEADKAGIEQACEYFVKHPKKTTAELVEQFELPISGLTLRMILKRKFIDMRVRESCKPQGRKNKLDSDQVEELCKEAEANPRTTLIQLKSKFGLDVDKMTISRYLKKRGLKTNGPRGGRRSERLDARDTEIAKMRAKDMSAKSIALKYSISVYTVYQVYTRLQKREGQKNRFYD